MKASIGLIATCHIRQMQTCSNKSNKDLNVYNQSQICLQIATISLHTQSTKPTAETIQQNAVWMLPAWEDSNGCCRKRPNGTRNFTWHAATIHHTTKLNETLQVTHKLLKSSTIWTKAIMLHGSTSVGATHAFCVHIRLRYRRADVKWANVRKCTHVQPTTRTTYHKAPGKS